MELGLLVVTVQVSTARSLQISRQNIKILSFSPFYELIVTLHIFLYIFVDFLHMFYIYIYICFFEYFLCTFLCIFCIFFAVWE